MGRFEAETQSSSRRFQTDNMKVYMDSMVLVVTLGEFQSSKKASQHLSLKNNCEDSGHISLDSFSDLRMYFRG